MPSASFRFLHAGDFHLERPLEGLDELPESLSDVLVDAPLAAARRLFETAILEEVAFVVLSGDVLDPRTAGPRALGFLLEQFELLADHGIAVYWAGGQVDRADRWPPEVRLPDSVHVFGDVQVEELSHFRGDQPLATVMGVSAGGQARLRSSEFRASGDGLYTIAVTYGRGDVASLDQLGVDYWALGGCHEPNTPLSGPRAAHYPGSPQGRNLDESGPHGGTLVHVEGSTRTRIQLVPTDSVRWLRERIRLTPAATLDDLKRLLAQRAQTLAAEAGQQPLLVGWTVHDAGRLAGRLRQEGLAAELVGWLRERFGESESPVWTVSLDADAPEVIPEECQAEETILGDFLRTLEEHHRDPKRSFQVQRYLGDHDRGLLSAVSLSDHEVRQEALEQARLLGFDLLGGEDAAAWLRSETP